MEKTKTMPLSEILNILRNVKAEVKQRYKAEIKGVFGSYVRGDEGAESDIDMLVEFDKGADLFDFVGLGLFLEEKLNRKVDIVPKGALREELRESILKEAVSV